jgi:hypothetical protein
MTTAVRTAVIAAPIINAGMLAKQTKYPAIRSLLIRLAARSTLAINIAT